MFLVQLAWNNPYRDPPTGRPRVIAEILHDSPKAPEAMRKMHVLGSGYSFHISRITPPTGRQLSQETLARVRRNRTEKRLKKKYPLFWEQLFEDEVKAKPDYYAGVVQEEHKTARDKDVAIYNQIAQLKGKGIIIYEQGGKDEQ